MKHIDFTSVVIKDIEGNETTVDISKNLAAILYKSAVNKDGLEIAKQIYTNGSHDVDSHIAKAIKQILLTSFLAVVQEALIPELDDIINKEQFDGEPELADGQATA